MNTKELMNSVIELNKKIESVNKERTRVETQRDMLNKQLSSLLEKYKSATGVSLAGKSLEETRRLVQLEFDVVFKRVSEEYEFKNKVVQLISEGRYEEANNALKAGVITEEPAKGIAVEEPVKSAPKKEEVEEDTIEFTQPVGTFAVNSVSGAFSDMEEEDDDTLDFGFNTKIEEQPKKEEVQEDDFDDDDFGFGDILNGSDFLI